MSMRPQIPVAIASPDADLAVIRQCGIRDVSLMLKREEIRDDAVARMQDHFVGLDRIAGGAEVGRLHRLPGNVHHDFWIGLVVNMPAVQLAVLLRRVHFEGDP